MQAISTIDNQQLLTHAPAPKNASVATRNEEMTATMGLKGFHTLQAFDNVSNALKQAHEMHQFLQYTNSQNRRTGSIHTDVQKNI